MNTHEIKLFAMDVDGTLTDGKLYVGHNGEAMKAFHVKDGYGIVQLIEYNVIPAIITAKESEIVTRRAQELGVREVWQGISDQAEVLKMLSKKYQVSMGQIAFIGDDDPDCAAMELAGYSFAPADASENTKKTAKIILTKKGGEGAVREAIDILLSQ